MKQLFFSFFLGISLLTYGIDKKTFTVEDIKRPEKSLHETSLDSIFQNAIAHSKGFNKLVKMGEHNFYFGVQKAYNEHRPLVISPDMIWLLISQGFAQHVINNPDKLRNMFVSHTGKVTLVVYGENGIDLDNPDSEWEKVFPSFSEKIAEQTGNELINTLTADFSTTNSNSLVASQITIMNAMSPFFDYIYIDGGCGISQITLEGTTEDWGKVLNKAESLRKYKLDWWINELEPVLNKFIKTSQGDIDKDFWKNICKIRQPDPDDGCGASAFINGWVTSFFPYQKDGKRNKFEGLDEYTELPSEICQVDLVFVDAKKNPAESTKLVLLAGFFGLSQQADFGLRPEIGWMIKKKESNIQNIKDYDGSIYLRVKDFPTDILEVPNINFLQITFTDSIQIPKEIEKIKIQHLRLIGKIEQSQINFICKLLPLTEIDINDSTYQNPEKLDAIQVKKENKDSILQNGSSKRNNSGLFILLGGLIIFGLLLGVYIRKVKKRK